MQTGENDPLFEMSPPVFRGVNTTMSDGSSLSLSNSGLTQKAPVSMSNPARAPFGELQVIAQACSRLQYAQVVTG